MSRLSELQKLRGMTPRAALTKHLLDGDDSFFTGQLRQAGAPSYCGDPRHRRCCRSGLRRPPRSTPTRPSSCAERPQMYACDGVSPYNATLDG